MGKAMWLEYFLTISLQAPAVGVLLALFVEVQEDGGAGDGARCGLECRSRSCRRWSSARPGLSPALRETTSMLVGDHEGAVEADAELADEVGVLFGVAGELREEVLGAGAGDGAEVGDEVLLVHADAGVGDGEGVVCFVEL